MFGNEKFTDEELEAMENALKKRLGRNYLSTRPAMGGQHVVYIEGWKVVDIANAESTTSSPTVGTTDKENTSKEINSKVESLTPTLTPNGSDQSSRNSLGSEDSRLERIRKAQLKKQEYEAKRKLSTDTLEPVIITNGNNTDITLSMNNKLGKVESKTPTPNQQLETSFICEDDTEFWENMTQMQDAATAKAGRSPATKRKKMTKDSNSPKFAAPLPKKR